MVIILSIYTLLGLITRNFHMRNILFPDWDSGIYAQVAVEILNNNSLITTFNGDLWLNKPPLIHAMIAGIFAIFGRSEFWARMLMIVFASALLVLTYKLAKKVTEQLFAAELKKLGRLTRQALFLTPPAALAATGLFIQRSTLLNTDIALGVGWVGYFLYRRNYAAKLGFLILGVWSKSFLGIYPLLFEILLIRRRDITIPNILKAIPLVILPFSWHIYSYLRYGDFFIKAHVADQVVKRVVAPIELHFGGLYYYPHLAWENLGGVAFFLFIAYLLTATIIFRTLRSKRLFKLDKTTLWHYATLLSPWPYFIFLVFIKSKIPWYLASVLPLFCIALPIFFIACRDRFIRLGALIFTFAYFISAFTPQTYLLKPNPGVSPKLKLAQCIAETPYQSVAFLVHQDERNIRNVLEAAQLQTETSFMYGGSPSFVYYSQKKIGYFYDPEEFANRFHEYDMAILHAGETSIHAELLEEHENLIRGDCSNDSWTAYITGR